MKLGKRFRWMIIFAILLTSLAIFLTHVDSVQATFSDMHMFGVMLRVESEIMKKTPAGQYYDALFWKHSEEIAQLITANPGTYEELVRVNRLFIPGLEALLDGKGDTVRITSGQVEGFKTQLAWFSSRGSPALQEDIEREQQRLPLDNFVGMTMSDALDLINSKWTLKQVIVPNSDGKWAYYFQNGVYLEYPTSYYVRLPISDGYVGLVPSRNLPGDWNPSELMVEMLNMPVLENDILNPSDWYPAERILWHREVQNGEFEGFEMIQRVSDTQGVELIAILYNRENQRLVYIHVYDWDENLLTAERFDYYNWINQHYEYFQHMVDHIHLQTP